MSDMRSLIRELWRYRWRVLIGILALLIVDASQLVVPWIVGSAIDDLQGDRSDRLLFFAVAVLALALAVAVFRFFWRYYLIGASRNIRRDIRDRLYNHILTLPASYFQSTATGDLIARFTNDIEAVMRSCGFGILSFADFLIMVSFSLTAMVLISPTLTLYAFLPLPVITIFALFLGRIIHRRFQDIQETFSRITEKVHEGLAGIRTIKSFAREEGQKREFAETNKVFVRQNMRLVTVSGIFDPTIMLMAGVSTMVTLWLGGAAVIRGEISLGDFVAFMSYLELIAWPMMALGMVVDMMQRGAASMGRIEEVLRTPSHIVDVPNPRPVGGPCRLEFRNVSFGYGDNRVLRDISLRVDPGKSLGIVGLTGAGKSTVAHLLLRIDDPLSGAILLDGEDLRTYALKELRKNVVLVPQDPFLFSTTIRENIAFSVDDAPLEQVRAAARIAGIEEEILAMSDGFETVIGERGVTLSGGQKQRVAIARAVFTDPRVLILDDALSAVDASKEEDILRNLREVIRSRISIVIAHRISAVQGLDHIIVIDDGKIVEEGRHDALVARDGLYAHLDRLQRTEAGLEPTGEKN